MSRLLAVLAACLAVFPPRALSSPSRTPSPLERRQADGLVDPSNFLRRAYHRAEVLDGWLYIDGGEFSFRSVSGIKYQYSTSLLAIDLSQDFTGASVKMISTPKPTGVPSLRQGGLWVDRSEKVLYMGFAGAHSAFGDKADSPKGLWSFKPNGKGGGSFAKVLGAASTWLVDNPRPFDGLSASGASAGYFFGGFEGDHPDIQGVGVTEENPASGMLIYDFKTQTLTKTGVVGAFTDGQMQRSGMLYVPNFGREGILVSIGGCQRSLKMHNDDFLAPTNIAHVYDIASRSWHEQLTTGTNPQPRKDFCVAGAASRNKTYEILVYAGWGGNLGSSAIPFDEAYILSLPSFRWFKADYTGLKPRHGVSCHHVGGGQIITIGGADTTISEPDNLYRNVFNSEDSLKQGIGIFDLGSLKFADSYKSGGPDHYTLASDIQSYYNRNARLPTFDSPALSDIFTTENFTAEAGGKPSADSATNGNAASPQNQPSPNVGAIVGGVLAGVAVIAMVAGAVWFFLRRRRQRQDAAAASSKALMQQGLWAGPGSSDAGGAYEQIPQGAQPGEMAGQHEFYGGGSSSISNQGSTPAGYRSGHDGQSVATRASTHMGGYDAAAPAAAGAGREPTPSVASEARYELHSQAPGGLPYLQQQQQQHNQVHEVEGLQGGRAQSRDEDNYKYNMRF